MRRAILLAALLLAPALSQAGVGASIRSNDAAVYLPMDVRPGLRLEPYFEYGYDKEDSSAFSITRKELLVGFGAFVRRAAADRLEGYAGGRVAYVRSETDINGAATKADGFRIEPTLGAEFMVTDRVSVAIEEYLGYENLDGSDPAGGTSSKSVFTGNRILLRIFLPHPERHHH